MCIHTHIILQCPECPTADNLGFEAQKCASLPCGKVSCDRVTTRLSHRSRLCPRCNPDPSASAEQHNIWLLNERLRLKIDYLSKTAGFPEPSSIHWDAFWKGLDGIAKALFVEVWSLQGEIVWAEEEMVRDSIGAASPG